MVREAFIKLSILPFLMAKGTNEKIEIPIGALFGSKYLSGAYAKAADVNKDGVVDFKDMLKINKYRLGKTSNL